MIPWILDLISASQFSPENGVRSDDWVMAYKVLLAAYIAQLQADCWRYCRILALDGPPHIACDLHHAAMAAFRQELREAARTGRLPRIIHWPDPAGQPAINYRHMAAVIDSLHGRMNGAA